MAINFTSGLFQGLDNDGEFVPYGLVYFTDPNTGAAIQTYSDSDLTQPNTHPIVLSPSGKAYIIVPDNTVANIRFDNADGVTIWYLESYDITSQTAIDNLSAILVSSEDNVLNAESWANQDEDVPVEEFTAGVGTDVTPTSYSAKHYATKSIAGAVASEASAATSEAFSVISTNQALDSATSAGQSEVSAASAAASAGVSYGSFLVTDGDLIIGYYDPTVSTPSIVDGDFILTY